MPMHTFTLFRVLTPFGVYIIKRHPRGVEHVRGKLTGGLNIALGPLWPNGNGISERRKGRKGWKERRGGKGRKEGRKGREGKGNDTQGKEENGMKGKRCKLRKGNEG